MHAAGMVKRVEQEVSIHYRLKHPSILELYTFFEDSNYVYLVLELCHNGELRQYIKDKLLTESEVSSIMKQVVEGSSIYTLTKSYIAISRYRIY